MRLTMSSPAEQRAPGAIRMRTMSPRTGFRSQYGTRLTITRSARNALHPGAAAQCNVGSIEGDRTSTRPRTAGCAKPLARPITNTDAAIAIGRRRNGVHRCAGGWESRSSAWFTSLFCSIPWSVPRRNNTPMPIRHRSFHTSNPTRVRSSTLRGSRTKPRHIRAPNHAASRSGRPCCYRGSPCQVWPSLDRYLSRCYPSSNS